MTSLSNRMEFGERLKISTVCHSVHLVVHWSFSRFIDLSDEKKVTKDTIRSEN